MKQLSLLAAALLLIFAASPTPAEDGGWYYMDDGMGNLLLCNRAGVCIDIDRIQPIDP
jgi:hypothetical protein